MKDFFKTLTRIFSFKGNREAVRNIRKIIEEVGGPNKYGYLSEKRIKKINEELDKIF